jgi:heme-degrading monooxygenase HmoA
MYSEIRHYRFERKNSQEIGQRIRDTLTGLVEKAPGFISFYWVDTANGEGISFSVFEDKARAENSERIITAFAKEHLSKLGFGAPIITRGEVQAHTERILRPRPGKERAEGRVQI